MIRTIGKCGVTPTCEIINDKFSWILKVDGQEIPFQGGRYVDYFKKHYSDLGYIVIEVDNSCVEPDL